jgi:hypothetical protein
MHDVQRKVLAVPLWGRRRSRTRYLNTIQDTDDAGYKAAPSELLPSAQTVVLCRGMEGTEGMEVAEGTAEHDRLARDTKQQLCLQNIPDS